MFSAADHSRQAAPMSACSGKPFVNKPKQHEDSSDVTTRTIQESVTFYACSDVDDRHHYEVIREKDIDIVIPSSWSPGVCKYFQSTSEGFR